MDKRPRLNPMAVKTAVFFTLAAGIFFSTVEAYAAANVLQNPNFENALGNTNGQTNWNSESNRGISQRTASDAPEGSSYMRLSEPSTLNAGFGGVFTFQTVTGASVGQVVTFSGLGRVVANNGAEVAQIRLEYQTAAGVFISADTFSLPTAVTSTFSRYSVSGTAPAGTGQVTFVIRIQPSTAGDVGGTFIADFDNMIGTFSSDPITVNASPVNSSSKPGQLKLITVQLHNQTSITQSGDLVIEPQDGLIVKADQAKFDGRPLGNREGSVIFGLNLNAGEDVVFGIPVVLSSAAVAGKSYVLTIFVRHSNGVTTPVEVIVRPELDPVFDEGTIIGKVFNDLNKNGVQDDCVIVGTAEKCTGGEKGIPFVQIATEEGIVVTTDENGMYHIPAVKPGRHVIKVDGHSLPEGSQFVTEESFLVKTTPGILNKANFAVWIPPSQLPAAFEKDLSVSVTQGLDTAQPTLGVQIEPDLLKIGIGVLEKEPSFRFKINYPDMVKGWYLEIRDESGAEVWTGFGVSAPPDEVIWPGKAENGLMVKPGVYSYQFKVTDAQGHQDWTPLQFFRVISKLDKDAEKKIQEIPPIGDFNIFKDGRRSIPLIAKPTIRVQGRTKPGNKVRVNSYTIEVQPDGLFETQIYTAPGQKQIQVSTASPEGETTTVQKSILVKDSTFFMTALGEEQMGINFTDGNLQTVAQEDTFKDGFYEEGRLSYYLKGKIKGKFIVKSHYDTDDRRSALFTNLDPDQYYPVYGDASSIDYEARDTASRFFLVVEQDKAHLKYGSFKTGFTDTELATYNRTLTGLQGSFETLDSTPYGDPKRGIKFFGARTQNLPDHNEFAATGGSLYYVRFRNIIEGSEKIRVEVRDKIQDMVLQSYDLVEGKDYEIDYREGRILLSRPLSSVTASDTLSSTDILDGAPLYLIVDYEYDAGPSAFDNNNGGLRGYTHMGDHIRIGATAVKEKRQNLDYDVRGIDGTIKMGRNTKVTMEYAESKNQQTESGVSYNGGLTFGDTRLPQARRTVPDKAYLLKAESKPVKNLETSGYIQGIHPGFSTSNTQSQAGTHKYGFAAKYKFTDSIYARYRFDNAAAENRALPLETTGLSAPFSSYRNHTGELVYDDGNWLGEVEYRRSVAAFPPVNLLPTLLYEDQNKNALTGKIGKRFNDRILPYVKVQTTFDGKPNRQYGAGVRYELVNHMFAYVEQMFGNIGDSTQFGIEQYRGSTRSYANMRMLDLGTGLPLLTTTLGDSFSLTEKSRLYSERQYTSYSSVDGYATDAMGYQNQINDQWSFELRGERRHLKNSTTRLLDDTAQAGYIRSNSFNTITGGVAYNNYKKTKARVSLEYRRDQDTPRLSQWVSRNLVEHKVTQDISALGKFDYGKTDFIDPDNLQAGFTEMSMGAAYRPVDNDRLNILTRYTYLKDIANDAQFYGGIYQGANVDETAHILAIDLAYEIHRNLGLVEKLAYKRSLLDGSLTNQLVLHNFLWVNRFNFHVTRKWDVALEYRALWQFDAAQTLKHGALVEVDRELYDYVRLGVGYNFTDFDDDLRKSSNINSHGPFVRLTGKI